MPLTSRQRAVVEAPLDRCVLVNAGPGTGKTHVLVERFLHLVGAERLTISDVLVVTFAREAAREVKERIARRLLEAGRLSTTLELEQAWISSYHGLCFRLLRENGLVAGFDPMTRILDQVEAADVAARARRRLLGVPVATRAIEAEASGDPLLAGVLDRLSWRFDHAIRALGRARESLLDPTEAVARAGPLLAQLGGDDAATERALHAALVECLPAAAAEYEGLKRAGGQVDFVDLEDRAVRFLAGPDGARLRGRFKAVLVDELQDTNLVQLRLLELLAGGRLERVMTVGDERQAIYAFRGARLENIRGLPARIRAQGGACDVLDLTESFRSYQEILDVSRKILPASTTLTTPLEAAALGPAASDPRAPVPVVRTFKATDKQSEAEWIAEQVQLLRGQLVTVVDPDGTRREFALGWGHFALLLRGVKSAQAYEDALRARSIPYRTIGGTGFYDRREVLDLLAYLEAIANPYDGLALVRILQNPPFGLSDRSLRGLANLGGGESVETDAHENKVVPGFRLAPYDAIRLALDDPAAASAVGVEPATLQRLAQLWAFLERNLARRGTVPVSRLLQDVLVETGYGKLLLADERSGPLEALRRRKNVERLLRMARRHEERHVYGSLHELVRYVHRALDEEVQEEEEAVEADDRVVNLMTVHQAKGLEWPVVFVGGLVDRSWPMQGFPDEVPFFEEGGIVLRTHVVGEEDGGKVRYPETKLHERLAAGAKALRDEEERRLLFVAMTRAKNLLQLSGYGPGTKYLDEVAAALPSAPAGPVHEPGLPEPTGEAPRPTPDDAAAMTSAVARVLAGPAAAGPAPVAKARHVQLSFSQVDLFATCPLRYKFTYVLPLPGLRHRALPGGRAEGAEPAELSAAELGSVFHDALERWAHDDRRLADLVVEAVRDRGWGALAPADARRVERFVENFLGSRLSARRPAPEDVEVPFSLRLERGDLVVTVNGAIDRLDEDGKGSWTVTDYKTNRGVEPERYALQLAIYRLAIERVLGRRVSGCFAYFVRHPETVGLVEVVCPSPAETEERLFAVAERIAARRFELSTPPPRETCWRCPFGGRDGPCPSRVI